MPHRVGRVLRETRVPVRRIRVLSLTTLHEVIVDHLVNGIHPLDVLLADDPGSLQRRALDPGDPTILATMRILAGFMNDTRRPPGAGEHERDALDQQRRALRAHRPDTPVSQRDYAPILPPAPPAVSIGLAWTCSSASLAWTLRQKPRNFTGNSFLRGPGLRGRRPPASVRDSPAAAGEAGRRPLGWRGRSSAESPR